MGKTLYQQRCQGCHLPALSEPDIDKHLQPIEWRTTAGEKKSTSEKVLDLVIIPAQEIGTDPAQGEVLVNRLIDTVSINQASGEQALSELGIDGLLCGRDTQAIYDNQLFGGNQAVDLVDGLHIRDGGNLNFAFALGTIVEQTIDAWFDANFIRDQALRDKFYGGRPNCLQAGRGYKARPLNGVWATAPFLHNGSVATLRDLICRPQEQRPAYVRLGDIRFNENDIGLVQPKDFVQQAQHHVKKGQLYTEDGYFILDTSIPGNSKQGHSFSAEYDTSKRYNEQKKGVIGPAFSEEECTAILEYVKTL